MKVRRRGGGMKERGEDGRDPKYRSTQSEKEKLRLLLVMTPVKVRPLGTRFHDRAHAIRLFSALPSFLPLPLTLTPLARSLSSSCVFLLLLFFAVGPIDLFHLLNAQKCRRPRRISIPVYAIHRPPGADRFLPTLRLFWAAFDHIRYNSRPVELRFILSKNADARARAHPSYSFYKNIFINKNKKQQHIHTTA